MDSNTRISKRELLRLMELLQRETDGAIGGREGRFGMVGVLTGIGLTGLAALGKTPLMLALRALITRGVLAASPAGWALAAVLASVGLWRFMRNRRPGSASSMAQRLASSRSRHPGRGRRQGEGSSDLRRQFFSCLRELIEHEAIAPANAFGFLEVVESGLMPLDQAHGMVLSRLHARHC